MLSDSNTLEKTVHPVLLDHVRVLTKKGAGQQRQISATIAIPHPLEKVWQVLTDYERMPDFIPNLVKTQKVPHPTGGIRLEQIAYCRVLNVRFSARIILDITESFPHQIAFHMVEGDFQAFSGSCQLEQMSDASGDRTLLHYSINVLPKLTMPIVILERQFRHDLPINLLAIRNRVDSLSG